jgi:hypothetical protein
MFTLSLCYVTFQCGCYSIFKKVLNFFLPTKSWKNLPKKLHTYGSWEVFCSAAPTAQNSPELHFRFINSFIQPSLLGSLDPVDDLRSRSMSSRSSIVVSILFLFTLTGLKGVDPLDLDPIKILILEFFLLY